MMATGALVSRMVRLELPDHELPFLKTEKRRKKPRGKKKRKGKRGRKGSDETDEEQVSEFSDGNEEMADPGATDSDDDDEQATKKVSAFAKRKASVMKKWKAWGTS